MPRRKSKKAKQKKQKEHKIEKKEEKKGISETKTTQIDKETREKQQEKQIRFIIFWMVLLIVFVASFIFFYRNAGTFAYNGIKFQKVNMNGLTLYKATLQFTRQDGIFKFDLYLRNNPRELEKIPVNATVVLRKVGFVSFDPRVSGCYGSNIPSHDLGTFLSAIGMSAKGATIDKNLSEAQLLPFKTCDDAVNYTVIVLKTNNESFIEQQGNCYVLNIAQCDIIPVTEKFILETLMQMLQRTKEKLNINNTNE